VPIVDDPAVDVHALGPGSRRAIHLADLVAHLACRLPEPLDRAALIPILEQQAPDVAIRASEKGIDSCFLGLAQRVLDARYRIIAHHLSVALAALMGKSAERVPTYDQARHVYVAQYSKRPKRSTLRLTNPLKGDTILKAILPTTCARRSISVPTTPQTHIQTGKARAHPLIAVM